MNLLFSRPVLGGLILIAVFAGLSVMATPVMAWATGQPPAVWRVALTVWGFWTAWHAYRLALKQ